MTTHNQPAPDLECMSCMEPITEPIYVEYQEFPDGPWLPARYCQGCIELILESQFGIFKKAIETADCKAAVRRILAMGCPLNIRDKHALPTENPNGEVHRLWFASDGLEHSAQLVGAPVGEERVAYWAETELLLQGMLEALPDESP